MWKFLTRISSFFHQALLMLENLSLPWNIVLCWFKERKRVDRLNFWGKQCSCGNFQSILCPTKENKVNQSLWERERTNKFGMVYEISNPSFDVLGADCRSHMCRTNNLHLCIKEDRQLLIILLYNQFFFSFCWILWPIHYKVLFTLFFTSFLSKFYITFWPAIKIFILYYFLTSNNGLHHLIKS